MKRWIIPLMLGFGVTLAFFIGQRMSTDAMAVVIGVAVGVAASVPMSVLLAALLRRETNRRGQATQPPMPQPYGYPPQQPMVLMLPGQAGPQTPQYGVYGWGNEAANMPALYGGQQPPAGYQPPTPNSWQPLYGGRPQ
jgi:hypothetical protein